MRHAASVTPMRGSTSLAFASDCSRIMLYAVCCMLHAALRDPDNPMQCSLPSSPLLRSAPKSNQRSAPPNSLTVSSLINQIPQRIHAAATGGPRVNQKIAMPRCLKAVRKRASKGRGLGLGLALLRGWRRLFN